MAERRYLSSESNTPSAFLPLLYSRLRLRLRAQEEDQCATRIGYVARWNPELEIGQRGFLSESTELPALPIPDCHIQYSRYHFRIMLLNLALNLTLNLP